MRNTPLKTILAPILAACAACAASPAALANTLMVDDDGPANFSTIQAAVDAAVAGDVIVVNAGNYTGFTVTKRLTLLGQVVAPPLGVYVVGHATITAPSGATLAGLHLQSVSATGVGGRVRLDDCVIGSLFFEPTAMAAVSFDGCAQAEVSRCAIKGKEAPLAGDPADGAALIARGSRVALVDCAVEGGRGHSPNPSHGPGGPGAPALFVDGGSDVIVAGCSYLRGGAAGVCYAGLANCHTDGRAGDAILAFGATVRVRGAASDAVEPGTFDSGFGATPGTAAILTGAVLVASGVTVAGPIVPDANSAVLLPGAPEPFLEIGGQDGLGNTRIIDVHGPAGAAGFLLAGLDAGTVPVPGFSGPLWMNPATLLAVLPVSTLGPGTPLSLPVQVPNLPAVLGLAFEVQAFFPGIPAALLQNLAFAGNPAALVPRP